MSRPKVIKNSRNQVWLITFADLMTIVLVLFVLMYSFSVVDNSKVDALVDSFNRNTPFQLGASEGKGVGVVLDADTQDKLQELLENEEKIKQIISFVQQFSAEKQFGIETAYTPSGVELILPEAMLFESGEAEVIPAAQQFLNQLAPMLQEITNEVKVEGHTDNVPISSMQYPTNWELSTARATHVIRYLTEKHGLDSRRFTAVGFGEHRPVASNGTVEGRSQNRRVVITISNFEMPKLNED